MADENLAARLGRLTPQQRALLLRQLPQKPAVPATIPRRANPGEPLPLSPSQLRMWFLEQLQPGTGSYHSYDYTRVTGPVDVATLEAAFREVIRRHESLRTSFDEQAGVPRQLVVPEVDFAIEHVDLGERVSRPQSSGVPSGDHELGTNNDLAQPADPELAARQFASRESLRPFDLSRAPLLRVVLVRIAEDDHLLLMTMHHIITDGWSLGVIDREVVALYDAFRNGRPSPLPELPVQFGDVVGWLDLPEQEAHLAGQLAWWKQTLAGVPDVLDLPADRPRPAVQSFRGARLTFRLPKELVASLQEVARNERATLFMVLLAAYETLLYRHTGQGEFTVGTPVANRKPAETEALVGLFINTVALRARVDGDEPFRDLLLRVRDTALDAFAHQEVPFDRVVDALGLSRSAGRTPLFQTMIVFGAGQGSYLPLDGVQRVTYSVDAAPARFDLTLSMGLDDDGVECVYDYATDLFDESTILGLAGRFESLLHGAAADPSMPVARLPLVDAAERARLVSAANGPARTWPAGVTLHSLFAEQAARTPEAAAIVAPGVSITYAELDAWSDDVAASVPAGSTIVALLADRSPAAIAAVLGILKAGAAYLPIDPGVPAERLAWMLADADAPLLPLPGATSDTTSSRSPLPGFSGRGAGERGDATGADHGTVPHPVPLSPRSRGEGTDSWSGRAEGTDSGADSPAYLIYTSGSTGLPKGVVVEHRSAVNLALAFAESHRFAGHRLLMIPPLPFDASVGDVFPALATGAALVLHPSPAELDATALARFCGEHGVTAIDAPAALWRRWTEEWCATGSDDPLPLLTLMMVGGESIPTDEVRRFAALTKGRVQFVNHYGPTEATVCATTFHTIDAADVATTELPIGGPIANVSAHVLDAHLEPVPPGVTGELYIGGAGVSRGYLGRDAETAERFVDDPFRDTPGARLYRTGDLARRRADGALLFLGRADRQIKLRGFRIEPGEIEAALLAHHDVRAALVMKRDERLVAYVAGSVEARELRAFLQERLPDFMVPSAIVPVDALPLTSNGKVDLNALPAPPELNDANTPVVAPRNDTERALVEIWREVLGRERIGIDDDFFAHGGDSLRTMPLIFRIRREFGIDVPLSAVFTAPTVARFAMLIAKGAGIADAVADDKLESRVGPPITIEADAARSTNLPPRAVLLTGATGFLGAFLAEELLRTTAATLYCLVRAASTGDALRRIEENLAAYGLGSAFDRERIIPLLGDLALPHLGLDEATLAHLAATIDVIYHNGGAVNFVVPYEKLEAANVDGTREVLRLAARTRVKPVHLVSTLGVHFTKPRIGQTVTESDALPPGSDVLGGYNETKWVADRVARRARAEGVPVSIHRPARITGDSRTGALNPTDLFYSWIKGCLQLGSFPDDAPVLNMAPVNHVARSIVALSLDGAAPADYHYFNNRTLPLETLVATLRGRGFPAEIVPYRIWIASLHRAVERGEDNALAKFIALMEEPDEGEPSFDCTATEAALAALGVVCPPADAALLNRYLDQLTARGFLPVPAIAEGGA